MMTKYKHIIAIDPDVDKSGVAELDVKNLTLSARALDFPSLLDLLEDVSMQNNRGDYVVVVEAGYLNRSNWHISRGRGERVAGSIGNSTGRNHETARKIVEMARHYGLETIEAKPLRKFWGGKDKKITHEELAEIVGVKIKEGLGKRSSQDVRDAILLAWYEAGFPIKVKVK